MFMRVQIRRYWLIVLLLCLLPAAPALAHGVKIEYTAGQALVVQLTARYDTGEPMDSAQVTIYAPDTPSQPWMSGTSDPQGRFSFTPDQSRPGTWEVQFRKAGHGGVVYVEVAPPAASAAAAAVAGGSSGYTPLQLLLMGGCVIWGLIGTALFFVRRSG